MNCMSISCICFWRINHIIIYKCTFVCLFVCLILLYVVRQLSPLNQRDTFFNGALCWAAITKDNSPLNGLTSRTMLYVKKKTKQTMYTKQFKIKLCFLFSFQCSSKIAKTDLLSIIIWRSLLVKFILWR